MKTPLKQTFRTVLAAGTVLALGACAGNWDVDAVSALPDKGSAFQSALHKEYVDLARMERDEADWTDASFFNTRAQAAANGDDVGPQEIAQRTLPDDMVGTLSAAREKLVAALAAGAGQKPAAAARAQAMFDCWMQEQEENFQPDDIAKCRADFDAAMADLTAMAAPEPKPMPAPKPTAKKPAPPSFTVYFGFDSDVLDSEGMSTVEAAAGYAKENAGKLVILKGHTDRSGANAYNVMLSERRSAATAGALVAAGVDADRIHMEGHGEYEPAVSTDDGVREAKNRRVTITFSK
jgi:outer membrane protein OmpA-like peptidoglycan-associated protein